MIKQRFNYSKLTAICAVMTTIVIQVVSTSVPTTSASPSVAFTDADLSSENRTLGSFVTDLGKFDKKGLELGKKASLTRAEFVTYEQSSNDLKRRVSSVQNALRESIRKLKAAGQWDNLNQLVLAKTPSQFRRYIEQDNFRNTLEELASTLSDDANQISVPVDAVRSKAQAQVHNPSFERGAPYLASRAVRVVYTTVPAMFKTPVRCALSRVRLGLANLVSGRDDAVPTAVFAVGCYCDGNPASCALL